MHAQGRHMVLVEKFVWAKFGVAPEVAIFWGPIVGAPCFIGSLRCDIGFTFGMCVGNAVGGGVG
eukprot:7385024-Ditylum_brightwellii.AAC.2